MLSQKEQTNTPSSAAQGTSTQISFGLLKSIKYLNQDSSQVSVNQTLLLKKEKKDSYLEKALQK